jgi:hypothetical protein
MNLLSVNSACSAVKVAALRYSTNLTILSWFLSQVFHCGFDEISFRMKRQQPHIV